jgi:hypothetical protein
MFRFKLRTLQFLLAIGPPALAVSWWSIRTGAVDEAVDILIAEVPWIAASIGEFTITFGLPVVALAYFAARCAAAVTNR